MVLRPDAHSRPGGDTVQAERTARALGSLGIHAWVSGGGDFSQADIVHAFNLHTPDWTLRQVRAAHAAGKPVVLSPVYWRSLAILAGSLPLVPKLLPDILRRASHSNGTRRFRLPRTTALFAAGHLRTYREILRSCRMILPNSTEEASRLATDFAELRRRTESLLVVPNAVDVEAYDRFRQGGAGAEPESPAGYVLCSARIEFRKNQLRLIEATRRLGLPLVLVGGANRSTPLHDAYLRACVRRGGNATFLDYRPQEALWPLYTACAVHCLPSFYETPGLSSLEAGLAGARVVTTRRGSPLEYFGGLVEYCEPTSVRSIADALSRALLASPSGSLSAHIRAHYTWAHAAKATRAAYEAALS